MFRWLRDFALGTFRSGDSHCAMCTFSEVFYPCDHGATSIDIWMILILGCTSSIGFYNQTDAFIHLDSLKCTLHEKQKNQKNQQRKAHLRGPLHNSINALHGSGVASVVKPSKARSTKDCHLCEHTVPIANPSASPALQPQQPVCEIAMQNHRWLVG